MRNFNFVMRIWRFYGHHLTCLMLPFQPIIDNRQALENLRDRKYRYHYLFPLILNSTILLDSLVVLLTVGNTPETPVFFFHIFQPHMPVFYRARATVGFPASMILSVISNLALFLDQSPQLEFIMYHDRKGSIDHGKVQLSMPYRKWNWQSVNHVLAKKLVGLNRWLQKQIRVQVWILTLQLNVGFTIPFVITEISKIVTSDFEYFPSFRTILVALVCPFHLRAFATLVHIGIQFMVQNYIIQTKQKHYLFTMTSGLSKLTSNFRFAYSRFCRTMARIQDLTKEIEAYNKFYRIHVTFIIILYGFTGCAVLNAIMQSKVEALLVYTIVWVVFSIIHLLFTFLFSTFSSRTLYLNVKLFKKLRQSQINLLSERHLSPYQIIKLDLVNEYKLLLQKCSFKLVNSSLINNKLFAFQIFGSVSFIYMKLMTDSA